MDPGRLHCIIQGTSGVLYISWNLLTRSLQLETDPELLIPKACAALERYGHQVVIGNDLNRRKYEVVFVSRRNAFTKKPEDDDSGFQKSWLRINPSSFSSNPLHVKEIEEDIVTELVGRHQTWIEAASVRLWWRERKRNGYMV
jgi:phosphopantothenate---cysteine ligase (ATP)